MYIEGLIYYKVSYVKRSNNKEMLKKIFFRKKQRRVNIVSKDKLDLNKLPQHIGIIMDGNGRWATKKGLIRTSGHKAGANTVKNILLTCIKLNIPVLTVYAFSTENWKRPKTEVQFLMNLFSSFLAKQIDELCENNVRIKFIGRINELPGTLANEFHKAEERTRDNTGVRFNVAINYGGRDEIITAVKNIAQQVKDGLLSVEDIDDKVFDDNLYTKNLPPVDLMIRTSGDMRLSNFLLWQSAYAEFWFTKTNWPDFTPEEFIEALIDFQHRDRRFGGLDNK